MSADLEIDLYDALSDCYSELDSYENLLPIKLIEEFWKSIRRFVTMKIKEIRLE